MGVNRGAEIMIDNPINRPLGTDETRVGLDHISGRNSIPSQIRIQSTGCHPQSEAMREALELLARRDPPEEGSAGMAAWRISAH